jgi:lipopolysaccharide export system protein LptA
MRMKIAGLITTVVMVLLGSQAHAQSALTRGSGPTDITADELEVIKAQCKSIFRGDAEALQGATKLRAKIISAFAAPKGDGCGDTRRLEADGDVYYVTAEQTIRGDHAIYTLTNNTVVVTGDVIVVDGKNVARGDRVTFNTRTGAVLMQSDAKGRGARDRVRGVFYSDSDPSSAPTSLAPTTAAPASPPQVGGGH